MSTTIARLLLRNHTNWFYESCQRMTGDIIRVEKNQNNDHNKINIYGSGPFNSSNNGSGNCLGHSDIKITRLYASPLTRLCRYHVEIDHDIDQRQLHFKSDIIHRNNTYIEHLKVRYQVKGNMQVKFSNLCSDDKTEKSSSSLTFRQIAMQIEDHNIHLFKDNDLVSQFVTFNDIDFNTKQIIHDYQLVCEIVKQLEHVLLREQITDIIHNSCLIEHLLDKYTTRLIIPDSNTDIHVKTSAWEPLMDQKIVELETLYNCYKNMQFMPKTQCMDAIDETKDC